MKIIPVFQNWTKGVKWLASHGYCFHFLFKIIKNIIKKAFEILKNYFYIFLELITEVQIYTMIVEYILNNNNISNEVYPALELA